MYSRTITEDRREIYTVLKSFVNKDYEARKLIYNHVSYSNIEETIYDVKRYTDELTFTSAGRLWLVRTLESFKSDFSTESMENIHKRVSQGCVKPDDYINEICSFPLNGELEIIGEYRKNEKDSK